MKADRTVNSVIFQGHRFQQGGGPPDGVRIGSLFHNGKKELSPFLRENRDDVCLALWVLPGGIFANHGFRQIRRPTRSGRSVLISIDLEETPDNRSVGFREDLRRYTRSASGDLASQRTNGDPHGN
jgi:hypothetical protein